MASVQLTLRGHLTASPGRVWARLVDQEAIPGWLDPVGAVVSDGDDLLVHLRDRAHPTWVHGQIVGAEPRRLLELRLQAPNTGLRELDLQVNLSPADGGTSFELRVVGRPTLLGNLAGPLFQLRGEVAMARAVRGFRAALEAYEVVERRPLEDACPELTVPGLEAARLHATATL